MIDDVSFFFLNFKVNTKVYSFIHESLLALKEPNWVCCSNLTSAAFRAFSLRSVKSDGVTLPPLEGFPLKLYPLPEKTLVESWPRFIEARVGTCLFPDPPTGESSSNCLGSKQLQQSPTFAKRLIYEGMGRFSSSQTKALEKLLQFLRMRL
mmetsp:Transcript_27080/g.27596  ORF Transcript_27080/g.27596 Transcript_27080/m.27596 type:complete len:151 (+) Transcript_27080:900-1352(+)